MHRDTAKKNTIHSSLTRFSSSKKGFTLVEMLLYMGLVSIFLLVLTDLITATLDVRVESTAVSAVITDGEFIKNRMTYDFRRATALVLPATTGVSEATLRLTIAGATYDYALQGSNLTITVGGASEQLNSPSTAISNLSFTRIGNGVATDTVQVSYDSSSTSIVRGQTAETRTYAFTLGGR